jgi:hypothetical protein
VQLFAQDIQQRSLRIGCDLDVAAIHVKFDGGFHVGRSPVAGGTSRGGQCIPRVARRERSLFTGPEKILHSADFCPAARCAPERAKAQRAAPFGNLGNDWVRSERFAIAPDCRCYPQARTAIVDARARARVHS